MDKIKRYNAETYNSGGDAWAQMDESPTGEYVRYSDVEELERRNEVLNEARDNLQEVLDSKRSLTRQLDVALNGVAGAAPQASLCDIVAQVERYNSIPQYEISACYFPGTGEIEISYQRLFDGGEQVHLTLGVTPEQGKALVNVIDPCVYQCAQLAAPQPIGYVHRSHFDIAKGGKLKGPAMIETAPRATDAVPVYWERKP